MLDHLRSHNVCFGAPFIHRRRIKIWGRAEFVEDDAELLKRRVDADYKAQPERALVFLVEAWDVNCPQHIAPRFTREEIDPAVRELERRNAALQERVDRLEAEIAEYQRK